MDRQVVAAAMLRYALSRSGQNDLLNRYKSPLDALRATALKEVQAEYGPGSLMYQRRLIRSLRKIPGVDAWKTNIIVDRRVGWSTIVNGEFECGEIAALVDGYDGRCVGVRAERAIRRMFAKE